jgi:hypothetical protein
MDRETNVGDRTDLANCELIFRHLFELEQMVDRFNSQKPIFIEPQRLPKTGH